VLERIGESIKPRMSLSAVEAVLDDASAVLSTLDYRVEWDG
jgi:hypothetical protein